MFAAEKPGPPNLGSYSLAASWAPGKTTLILAAAEELERRGIRTAVILNDQGELADAFAAGFPACFA